MDIYDEETDSRMDDEELRAQVYIHGSIMTLRIGNNVEQKTLITLYKSNGYLSESPTNK